MAPSIAESGEDRGVLDTDDARTDHGQVAWQLRDAYHVVGAQDHLTVRRDAGRRGRLRAGGDQHVGRRHLSAPLDPRDHERVRIGEAGLAVEDRHPVASERRCCAR